MGSTVKEDGLFYAGFSPETGLRQGELEGN